MRGRGLIVLTLFIAAVMKMAESENSSALPIFLSLDIYIYIYSVNVAACRTTLVHNPNRSTPLLSPVPNADHY